MSRDWPLVGRRDQLRQVRNLIASPSAGGLVVAGQAGVGKTRLAVESLLVAEAAGYPTARVSGTRSGSGLPFGAIAPLLPSDDILPLAPIARAELLEPGRAPRPARILRRGDVTGGYRRVQR